MTSSCSASLDESFHVFAFVIWSFPRRGRHDFVPKNAPLCSRPSRRSRKMSFLLATNCLGISCELIWREQEAIFSVHWELMISLEQCWLASFRYFSKKHCKITREQKKIVSCPVLHLNELFLACGESLDTIQCTPYNSIQWWVHWCTARCRGGSISGVTVILKAGDAESVLQLPFLAGMTDRGCLGRWNYYVELCYIN